MSEDWRTVISDWFGTTGGGGLVLPDGWFGRPHDNIHQLTFLEARPLWLIIELDERLLLVVRSPSRVLWTEGDLLVDGFSSCFFERKEYGGEGWQAKRYTGGQIKFVGLPGR